jgi:4'-phosphopantetheinyl transferase EntD
MPVQTTTTSPALKNTDDPDVDIRAGIERGLARMVPAEVRYRVTATVPSGFHLMPAELSCCSRFAPRRLHDFTVGRYAASEALAQLGLERESLPIGDNREPAWPAGVVGSIAHTDGLAGAVAARRSDICGLGLDLEHVSPIADIAKHISTSRERDFLSDHPSLPDYWNILFSAKEAIYKCLWPLLRRFISFQDVSLLVDYRHCRYAIASHNDLGPVADRLQGYWAISDRMIVAVAVLHQNHTARLT